MSFTLDDTMQLLEAFENSDNFYSDILSFSKTVESCVLPNKTHPMEQTAHDFLEYRNEIPVESKSATLAECKYIDCPAERSYDFPVECSCDLPVACRHGLQALEYSPGWSTECMQGFPVDCWPGFLTEFKPDFTTEFMPSFSTEFRHGFKEEFGPGFQEECRPGFQDVSPPNFPAECCPDFPTECCPDFPTECFPDFPAECRSDFPSECRSDFPAECRSDFPAGCRSDFPAGCRSNFPAECQSDFPTECKPGFPTKFHSDFPVEHMSGICTKYMSGFPREYSQEISLNDTVEGFKEGICNSQKDCFTKTRGQHLVNSTMKFCSEIPESYRDEAFLEDIDNGLICSEIPKGFTVNTSLHSVANSFCSDLSREFIKDSSMNYESSTSISSELPKAYADEVTKEYMANKHMKYFSSLINKTAISQTQNTYNASLNVRSVNLSANATAMEANGNASLGLGSSQKKEMYEIVKKEKDILNEAMKEIGFEISFPQDLGINQNLIRKRRNKIKRLRHKNNQTVVNDEHQIKKTRVRFGGNGPLNKPRIFQCEVQKGICVAKFKTMHHLNHHVTTHQERDRKQKTTYRCSYYSYDKSEQCSVNVSKKLTLERHYLEHHNMFEDCF